MVVVDLDDPKQLQALSLRLLAFARRRAGARRWWLGSAGALAKGHTVEDIAAIAVASLFGAERAWDPSLHPDPWEYLKSVVNSELSNLATSSENNRVGRDLEDYHLVSTETPQSALLQAEEAAVHKLRQERAYSLLVDSLGDDKELIKLHDLIVDEGIDKPQDLAARLGMTVREVNNLKKRFWLVCRRVGETMQTDEGDND